MNSASVVFRFAVTRGALEAGGYRVVVLEADGRLEARDFSDLAAAHAYADDAASEVDPGVPIAYVLDERFEVVYRGRHY